MSVVLVDNSYYGQIIRRARKCAHIKRHEMSRIMGISRRDLTRYESGKRLIPESVLEKIAYHGMVMLAARHNTKRKH